MRAAMASLHCATSSQQSFFMWNVAKFSSHVTRRSGLSTYPTDTCASVRRRAAGSRRAYLVVKVGGHLWVEAVLGDLE